MAKPSAGATVSPPSETFIVPTDGTYRAANGDARIYYQNDVVDRATATRYSLGTSLEVEIWRISFVVATGTASTLEVSSNLSRPFVDLRNAASIRLVAQVNEAGAAGSECRLEWSSDGSTYQAFQATNQPKVSLATAAAVDSGLVVVPSGAKNAFVYLKLTSSGGAADSATLSNVVVSYLPS